MYAGVQFNAAYDVHSQLTAAGVTVEGTVEAHESLTIRVGKGVLPAGPALRVSYPTPAGPEEATLGVEEDLLTSEQNAAGDSQPLGVGSTVQVVYLPEDPSVAELAEGATSAQEQDGFRVAGFAVLFVVFAVGAFAFRRP